MPSIKATLNGDNSVKQFGLKWMLYNFEISSYEEVTDLSAFAEIVEYVGNSWDDFDGTTENGNEMVTAIIDFNDVIQTIIVPEETWYFFGDAATADFVMDSFRFGYRIYGANFNIEIRNWGPVD